MPGKVVEINLEYGMPSVDAAMQKMKNALVTSKGQGYKAVILIHGFGSSGTGGSIKDAVKRELAGSKLCGVVRCFAGGEQWFYRKKEMTELCRDLKDCERRISGNAGVTVVVLK